MKFGFIGAGNMASAMIAGAVSAGMPPEGFYVLDTLPEAQKAASDAYGVVGASSLAELVTSVGAVFLAVKPKNLSALLQELSAVLRARRCVVVSMVAGRDLAFLAKGLGAGQPALRILPNLNAAVCESVCAVCGNGEVTPSEKAGVMDLLNKIGVTIELEEAYFSVFSAVAGSGPAFVYLMMDSLARAALKHGMAKRTAREVAARMVLGSAKALLASDRHAWEMIDAVCSPGGLTIEGLVGLQEDGFEAAIIRAVDRVIAKDKATMDR